MQRAGLNTTSRASIPRASVKDDQALRSKDRQYIDVQEKIDDSLLMQQDEKAIRQKVQRHTTGGIPRWSPTLVLVARFSAYVWRSGRSACVSLYTRLGNHTTVPHICARELGRQRPERASGPFLEDNSGSRNKDRTVRGQTGGSDERGNSINSSKVSSSGHGMLVKPRT